MQHDKMLHKTSVLEMLVGFSHLVELTTVNRWLAASVLGFFFFSEAFSTPLNLFKFLHGFLGIFLVLCYVMAINDCFDVEEDIIKSKLTGKKLVVSQEITVRNALLMSLFMLFSGLTISFFVSKFFFLVVTLIVILSTLYSVPPVRYKKHFPLSTLGEFVGAILPFLSGYVILGGPVDHKAILISIFFALVTMYWRFFHENHFYEVDRQTGKLTFAVVYGPKVSKILRRACLLVGILESLILFVLGWVSYEFFILLGLYLLFALGFWYWFGDYVPKFAKSVLGPTWGFFFVATVIVLIGF